MRIIFKVLVVALVVAVAVALSTRRKDADRVRHQQQCERGQTLLAEWEQVRQQRELERVMQSTPGTGSPVQPGSPATSPAPPAGWVASPNRAPTEGFRRAANRGIMLASADEEMQ